MMKKIPRRLFFVVTFLLLLLVACATQGGQLKPLGPGGEGDVILAGQPQLVTFSQLQEDPDAFRDRLIRVSGGLLKVPPPGCVPLSGPAIEWAIISEELRLDATGFERAVSMLDADLPMTVDGFFRLYEGALGCGKAAPDGSAWYLAVVRIVQPNPLIASGLQPGGIIGSPATPGGVPPGGIVTPTGQATAPIGGTPGGTPSPTGVGPTAVVPTATETPIAGTITATVIPTASATSRFTPTPTVLPGTATSAPPVATPTPGATLGPGLTPTSTPSPTSEPYPGVGTPTPTPTDQAYPPFPPTTTPGYP
jgi:hypothetical protein